MTENVLFLRKNRKYQPRPPSPLVEWTLPQAGHALAIQRAVKYSHPITGDL